MGGAETLDLSGAGWEATFPRQSTKTAMRLPLLVLAVCLPVAACDTAADAPAVTLTSPGEWVLTSGIDFSGVDLYVVFDTDGTFRADGVCNRIAGRYSADGGQIDITVESTTEVACGALGDDIEAAFLRGLDAADLYEIDDRELSLDGRGVALGFQLRPPGFNV